MDKPPILAIRCFCCGNLGHYWVDLPNGKKMTAPAGNDVTADTVAEGATALMIGTLNKKCYSDRSDEFSG